MRCAIRRWANTLLLSGSVMLIVGCASQPKYGARKVMITLDSEPEKQTAYLIPNQKYLDDPTIASDPQRLSPYNKGLTPVTLRVLPYLWVYVAATPDRHVSNPITFNPADLNEPKVMAEWPTGK